MTSILKIHSVRGDDEYEWEPSVNDERLRKAEEMFQESQRHGFFAYSRHHNGNTRVLDEFDPNAREILMTVPLHGG
jgi:hypothetical protein